MMGDEDGWYAGLIISNLGREVVADITLVKVVRDLHILELLSSTERKVKDSREGVRRCSSSAGPYSTSSRSWRN
jgi:hypothetical protein